MNRQSLVPNGAQKYNGGRSSLSEWFSTPQGAYVLDWELAQFDSAVDDVFGFRAVQIGLPEVDFLRQNRVPYRFTLALEQGATLAADPLELPLADQSLDLAVLPHVLEGHPNPHEVLRDVARVLRPEGQVVISGFNTVSLWRIRQLMTFGKKDSPWDSRYISLLRLRDWLRVLGFELNGGMFGCYAPPCSERLWLDRFAFMEKAGARWWPIAGGIYVVRAIKRVQGAMLVTPAWRKERARRRALAAIPQRSHRSHSHETRKHG
jgi:SAM-dependent methyltransferase